MNSFSSCTYICIEVATVILLNLLSLFEFADIIYDLLTTVLPLLAVIVTSPSALGVITCVLLSIVTFEFDAIKFTVIPDGILAVYVLPVYIIGGKIFNISNKLSLSLLLEPTVTVLVVVIGVPIPFVAVSVISALPFAPDTGLTVNPLTATTDGFELYNVTV